MIRRSFVVLLAYAALTSVVLYPLLAHPFTQVPGGGDTWVYYWDLWWTKRAVDLHQSPFFTTDVYFPYGASLYFHTLNLLPNILALPIASTIGLAAAFNALVWMSFVGSGYAMYCLARHELDRQEGTRRDGVREGAAFLAGVVFTFSSYRFSRVLGHVDLLFTLWLPVAALLLIRVRERGDWPSIAACAACLTATALTAWYYALCAVLLAAILIVAPGSRAVFRLRAVRIVSALGLFLLMVAPVLAPMVRHGGAGGATLDPAADAALFSPDLLAFVTPPYFHPIWGGAVQAAYRVFGRADAGIERIAFLGVIPLAAGIIGARAKPIESRPWILIFLVFGALSLGPVLHVAGRSVPALSSVMPCRWLMALPFGNIPRVPNRFVAMSTMAVAVVAAFGFDVILRRVSLPRLGIASVVLSLGVIAEHIIFPLPMASVAAPPIFDWLRQSGDRGAILEAPIPDDPVRFRRRMFWQTVHERPVFGGYLARGLPPIPFDAVPGFSQFRTLASEMDDVVAYGRDDLAELSRAVLAAYRAELVVVEATLVSQTDRARLQSLAETILGPHSEIYRDTDAAAYRVPPLPDAPPAGAWLEAGWSYLERDPQSPTAGSRRWRWMGQHARIGVLLPKSEPVTLTVTAQAFKQPRRLRFDVGGRTAATVTVTTDVATHVIASLALRQGLNFIELESLDGAESPAADRRALSVAFYRLELTTVSSKGR